MDIFTDASLNDSKKIAGVGCVGVDANQEKIFEEGFSLSTNNIHVAELCALACAVKLAEKLKVDSVRIVSDSASALNTLYQYVCYARSFRQKNFLQKFERSVKQKIILEEMSAIFTQSPIHFSFVHTPGHQRRPEKGTEGYWNDYVDIVAAESRLKAEKDIENVSEIPSILSDTTLSENASRVPGHWTERVSIRHVSTQKKGPKDKKKENCRKEKEKDCNTYHVRINGPVHLNIDSKGTMQIRIVSKHTNQSRKAFRANSGKKLV